ncbi:hypothetical protein ACVWZM_001558 [Bradyrhizobium sp. USDA 4501]
MEVVATGWVASQITGTYGLAIRNFAATRSIVGAVTIAAANTWTPFSIAIPQETAGAWDFTNAGGMIVNFCLASASNWQIGAGTWQNVNAVNSTTGTAAFMGTSGNALWLTGFDLRVGSVGGFERVRASEMLDVCRTRFQKSWAAGTAVGTITDVGSERILPPVASTSEWCSVPFRPSLVSTPTVTLYSPTSGATGKVYSGSAAADVAGTVSFPCNRNFQPNWTSVANTGYRFHWTADARP